MKKILFLIFCVSVSWSESDRIIPDKQCNCGIIFETTNISDICDVSNSSLFKSSVSITNNGIISNFGTVEIFDDQNIIQLINNISIIPNNWVLLYLGCSQLKNWNKIDIINNCYYDPKSSCDGSFAIIITSKIFTEMIELIDNTLLPFDTGPLRIINSRYPNKCWAFNPNLIIADVRDSNIRTEGGNNYMYDFSRKCRWDLSNYYFG